VVLEPWGGGDSKPLWVTLFCFSTWIELAVLEVSKWICSLPVKGVGTPLKPNKDNH